MAGEGRGAAEKLVISILEEMENGGVQGKEVTSEGLAEIVGPSRKPSGRTVR